MSHECQFCGQQCYCDLDDIDMGGMPDDCPHWMCIDATEDDDEDGVCRLCGYDEGCVCEADNEDEYKHSPSPAAPSGVGFLNDE